MHFLSWKDWDCRGGYLLKYSSLMFTLLYWIPHGNSTRWQGDETGLTSQLISTLSLPTQPMKGCTTPPGCTPPTLYEQQCGFCYVPQESKHWKSCPERWRGVRLKQVLMAVITSILLLVTPSFFITRGSNYQRIFISNSWFRSGRRSKVGWNKVRCCEGKNISFRNLRNGRCYKAVI